VTPDDYGRVPVTGRIVSLSAQSIAIRRTDDLAGDIVVHFPRAGFLVTPIEPHTISSASKKDGNAPSGASSGGDMLPCAAMAAVHRSMRHKCLVVAHRVISLLRGN